MFVVTLASWLLIATHATNNCPPACPPGAISENEACGDEINKGCDAPGPRGSNCCIPNGGVDCDDIGCLNAVCAEDPFCCMVAWDQLCADEAIKLCPALCSGRITQQWLPIELGDTLCGTTWAEGYDSDADWYVLTFDRVTEVVVTLSTGVKLKLGIADLDGVPTCVQETELDPFVIVPACGTASVTACFEPGTHYVSVRPTGTTGIPCGSTNAVYVLSVEATGRSCVLPDPVNDTCATALPILEGSTPVSTHDAATEPFTVPTDCGIDNGFNRDVWFTYVATRDGFLRMATCGTTSFPTQLAMYSGTCDDLVFIGCDDDGNACLFGDPQLDIEVTQGQAYLLRVGSPYDTEGELVLTISYLHCVPPYTIEILDPSNEESVATDVANTGEIVGQRNDFDPFRWSTETGLQEILQSPSALAHVFGINSDGVAVGWMNTGGYLKPAAAPALVMTPLPNNLPVCAFGIAYAINESGQIVGGLFAPVPTCSNPTPVTWINGVISALPVPVATTSARDINESGSICGDGSTTSGPGEGWTLIDGVFAWIPPPSGGAKLLPLAINDSNVVVGDIYVRGSNSSRKGFVWDGSTLTQILPPDPYKHAALVDINNAGTFVGEFRNSTNVDSNGGAFMSRGGPTRMLNMLIGPNPNYGINDVRAINDDGVIVGAGGSSYGGRAVRLVPNPPSGDLNCDAVVDAVDLAGVLGAWGMCEVNNTCLADFTLDGIVDGADLAVVLGGWGAVGRR